MAQNTQTGLRGTGQATARTTSIPLCLDGLDPDIQRKLQTAFSKCNGNTTVDHVIDTIDRSETLRHHILVERRRNQVVYFRTVHGTRLFEPAELMSHIHHLTPPSG